MTTTGKSFKYYSFWVIALVFILNYLLVALGIDGMNVLMPALMQKFGWTPGEIMTKVSLGSLLSIITGFIVGSLIIKKGNKAVLVPGLLALGVLTILLANVKDIMQFSIVMILIGILIPTIMISSFSLVCNWFIKKRGIVFGIVTIAAPLSSATFTPLGTQILMGTSFNAFYTGWGIVLLLIGIFAYFTAYERPENFGLYPDGDDAPSVPMEEFKSEWSLKRVLTTKETWLIIFGWGFVYLMMTGIMSQFIPMLTTTGVPLPQALLMMSIAALLGMPISYIWGWLDDKIGTPKTSMIFSLCYIIASIGLLLGSGQNMVPFYLAMLMVAATTGGMPNLIPSLQGYVFGRKEFVNVNRYINVGHGVFRSIGLAYLAIFFDMFGSYKQAFISFIVLSVITCILFGLTKKTYDPERLELQKEGKAS